MCNDRLLLHPASWPALYPGDDLSGSDHNHFFVPSAGGTYVDISHDLGLDVPQVTRGIATADVDGDGLLDFAIAKQWEESEFYHNRTKRAGNFLQLYLLVPIGASVDYQTSVLDGHPAAEVRGRSAIGATAILHLPNGKLLAGQVDGGNGHSGKRSRELHFGLG